jgi:hypothetical protein
MIATPLLYLVLSFDILIVAAEIQELKLFLPDVLCKSLSSFPTFLTSSLATQTIRDNHRKLIRDADRWSTCYEDSADFFLDPFKANNDRGDWGKCMPEELFGTLW